MKPAPFTYHRPRTLAEAARLLADTAPEDGRILAGGQSLAPILAFRMTKPGHLIDINNVEGLDLFKVEKGLLRIGARVRHAMFRKGAIEGPTGAFLAYVMKHIAHYPIRTRGTFCGSLAHADPASEWCAIAALLDARLIAHSVRGTREIPVADYFQSVMTTALEADEILIEARLSLLPQGTHWGFMEFSRRAGDYALGMAMTSFQIEAGRIVDPRFAVGATEGFPRRLADVEAVLAGAPPTQDTWPKAADLAAQSVDPLEDHVTSADYRRDLLRSLAQSALVQASKS